MELAKQYDVPFLEVSAKNATNVDETFQKMASDIYERFLKTKKKSRDPFDPTGGSTTLKKPESFEDPVRMGEDPSKKKNSNCCT